MGLSCLGGMLEMYWFKPIKVFRLLHTTLVSDSRSAWEEQDASRSGSKPHVRSELHKSTPDCMHKPVIQKPPHRIKTGKEVKHYTTHYH
eukprot:4228913-Amphidinium_carterae.1